MRQTAIRAKELQSFKGVSQRKAFRWTLMGKTNGSGIHFDTQNLCVEIPGVTYRVSTLCLKADSSWRRASAPKLSDFIRVLANGFKQSPYLKQEPTVKEYENLGNTTKDRVKRERGRCSVICVQTEDII